MNIDINRVKTFNDNLKQENQKNATMQAELNFVDAEIAKECAALSQELGMVITPENVEAVMAEQERSLTADLEAGEAILERIRLEEQGLSAVAPAQMAQVHVAEPAPVQVNAQPVMPAASTPVYQTVQQGVEAKQAAPMQAMQFGSIPGMAPAAPAAPVVNTAPVPPAAPAPEVYAAPVAPATPTSETTIPGMGNIAGNNGQLPPLFGNQNNVMGI